MNSDSSSVIKRIREDYLKSPERARDSLSGAMNTIKKAFSRRAHFLMEFIQNSDDALSRRIRVELIPSEKPILRILNDGKPFDERDVEAICRIGRSYKSPEYIGYLGVGFKSVFLISDSVKVYSGDFSFIFDKNLNPPNYPWQIIPHPIEPIALQQPWTTMFEISLKQEAIETIRKELKEFHSRIILFLKHLESIEIYDGQWQRRISKTRAEHSEFYDIYEILDQTNGTSVLERWLVFSKTCDVPEDVRSDPITIDWDRENVKKREVVVAFALDENNMLKSVTGTAHVGAFSFLPLREEATGLNFIIQADFLTAPGREAIFREAKWNIWLAKEIVELVKRCSSILARDPRWAKNFLEILNPGAGGHEFFAKYVKYPIEEYLKTAPIVPTIDGEYVPVNRVIRVSEVVLLLAQKEELVEAFSKLFGKKITTINIPYSYGVPSYISSYDIANSIEILAYFAEKRNAEFFKNLYTLLGEYSETTLRDYFRRGRISSRIVLTDDWQIVEADKAYFEWNRRYPEELKERLKDKFKIVHPAVLDPKTKKVLEIAGVSEMPEDKKIENAIIEELLPQLKKEWDSYPAEERIKWLKHFYKLEIDPWKLKDLSLPSKSGKWLKPSELLFATEYGPEIDLEPLIHEGLLDIQLEFLDPIFISGLTEVEIRKWRDFFEKLGVGEKAKSEEELRKWVERVAILSAIRFERSQGRNPSLIDRSQQLGYDIESCGRLIEVKGTRTADPSICAFTLTSRELKTLNVQPDRYFVYFVINALRDPILYIIEGTEIREKMLQSEMTFRLNELLPAIFTVRVRKLPKSP